MPSIEGVCGCRFVGTTRTEEKNRRNKRSDEKWDYYKKRTKTRTAARSKDKKKKGNMKEKRRGEGKS